MTGRSTHLSFNFGRAKNWKTQLYKIALIGGFCASMHVGVIAQGA